MLPCDFYPASEDYSDFIFRYSIQSLESLYQLAGTRCVNLVSREFSVIFGHRNPLLPVNIARDTYAAIPKLYSLSDTTALESSGIYPVFTQPAISSTGSGVIMGIIDTGIDYTNPLFINGDGTSRILSIWDQSIPGPTPSPVSGFQPFYGTVYSREEINQALLSEEPLSIVPSTDTDGHGTFMAGVAGGNQVNSPTVFSGASPDCTLAIVKLKPAKKYLRDFFLIPEGVPAYQENDIMAAVSFLLGLATQYLLPIVIFLGVGTAQGSHDGTAPLSIQLRSLIGYRGLVLTVGAGNETGYGTHYHGHLSENQSYDDVELRVSSGNPGFCMELWASPPEIFTVGFVSPSGEEIPSIPLSAGAESTVSFPLDATKISVTYQTYEAASGSQLIFFRFVTPTPGIWHIRVYPTYGFSGDFNIWLPAHAFIDEETYFLRPDPDITINDPGNSIMPLTVGAYNHINNSIYIHSSRGYTRTNQIKPDIAAPGVNVQGPSLRHGQFTTRTGTSVSAAIAAGAVANLFSWGFTGENDQGLTSQTVQSLLIRGAGRSDAFSYPNRQWGYGTLDLLQSFLYLSPSR